MRAADWIIKELWDNYGIRFISLLTGNGSLVINDAIALHGKMQAICGHHEQDISYFSVGYSKYTNKLSVINPTTGCASVNGLTPLLASYQDHVPVLFLSGNVALKQTSRYHKKLGVNLKKLGTQELDIIEVVRPLTKYSVMIEDINDIKYEISKAIQIATTAPYGPVWIDLPANIGASLVDESKLRNWELSSEQILLSQQDSKYKLEELPKLIAELKNDLNNYERPICLIGNGIVLSNTQNELKKFVEKYKIPCVCTYGAIDVLEYDNSLYLGGPIGVKGCRASNFAIQSSNLLIVLGACLNTPQVGYMPEKFAPNSKKWIIDLDCENHRKDVVKIDRFINMDLKDFFVKML